MLARSILFAALAAVAVAAPAPHWGKNRGGRGGHRNNKWNQDNEETSASNDWEESTTTQEWSESTSTQAAADAESTDSAVSDSQVDGSSSSNESAVSGGFSSIASYYDITNPAENEGESAGSVACSGAKYANSDNIVAIASQQYNGGSVCGKTVRITDTTTGKTATATIVDECMSCQDHQLDLTPSLWSQLHGQSTDTDNNDGVFDIKWEFA